MVPRNSDPDWTALNHQRLRPDTKPVLYQAWRNLFFAHARFEVEVLAKMLPQGLDLDLFDDSAWLGFVPFLMRDVRPTWSPSVPGISNFLETNLRTYVTHPQHGPGVWFFSLEASNYIACYIARSRVKLPYFHSAMFHEERRGEHLYAATRLQKQRLPLVWPLTMNTEQYTAQIKPYGEAAEVTPETLEFWLYERYRLYSADYQGNLFTGKVAHDPYKIQEVTVQDLRVSGVEAEWEHFGFAPGFDVEVFGLDKV